VICTVPQLVELQPLNEESVEPEGGVQIVKLLVPPGLLRFQVPAQMLPVGDTSAISRFELAYVQCATVADPPLQLKATGVPMFPVCPHARASPVVSGCMMAYTACVVVGPYAWPFLMQ
jgi:hypothetical protein